MSRTPQPCDGVGVSPELKDLLNSLPEDHKFKRWINDMADDLLFDRHRGQAIEKRKIPSKYVELYGVNNLFRYAHPEGYRSCYTLLDMGNRKIHAWILDFLSHPEYEELFGYR
jgi:hypothetical protein